MRDETRLTGRKCRGFKSDGGVVALVGTPGRKWRWYFRGSGSPNKTDGFDSLHIVNQMVIDDKSCINCRELR